MSAAAATPALAAPAPADAAKHWLPWLFLFALVLPFDPFWFDFEQVRRGLLLLLTGTALVVLRRVRPVHGEVLAWAFVACLAASALIQWGADTWWRDAKSAATFQPWDAVYRLAHWLALLAVLRLGAARANGCLLPLASLLAATSTFGLLQRLGLAEIAGYGVEREPVSVFGNLNVGSEFTAVAAMAVAALLPAATPRGRRVAFAALGLAGAYLVVDGSRSGLVALPIGLVLLALLRRRAQGWLPLAVVAGGALVGLVCTAAPAPSPATVQAQRAERQRGTATLDVRWEIARSTTKLWAQSPIWGLGPGQFAVHYPRVRSDREIEISSQGRQFATEVRTAHDDWLELLIDGGLIALVAFAAMLFALQRRQPDKTRLLPLFVLLLLMLVRAPLWNAPASAIAFWCAAVPTTVDGPRSRLWRLLSGALGLALAALAVPVLVANHFAARWQAAVARGEQAHLEDVATAAACMPFEPRWQEILTREKLAARDLKGAATNGSRALQLRPHHPQLYLNLGEVLAQGNRLAEAEAVARQGLAVDPVHPELRVLRSTVLARQGKADAAIDAVVQQPHPTLRRQLANHFRDLAKLCRAQRDSDSAGRFLIEYHALAAIDRLGDTSADAAQAKVEHLNDLKDVMRLAQRRDVRFLVIQALAQLDLGNLRDAMQVGELAKEMKPLLPWQRELFGDQLERLRSFESWQPFFAKR